MGFSFRINLRILILLLAMLSAVIGVLNTFYASFQVQKEQLIDSTLESNRVYAMKMANIVERFISDVQQQLAFSAGVLANNLDQQELLEQEVHRLHFQENTFNSVAIVDAEGIVLAVSPSQLGMAGKMLTSHGAKEALQQRTAWISDQYISSAHNLVIFLTHPVFDNEGEFLGYVGGSIYLREKNVLFTLIGEHFYKDGSYLYVVDRHKQIIYHQHPIRIGSKIENNKIIDTVTQGNSGSMQAINSRGTAMLAGYAYLPITGWGIIAQRPLEQTAGKLNSLMLGVLYNVLPLALLTVLFIWLCSTLISRPLWQLARHATEIDDVNSTGKITEIPAWYFEVSQLKQAILIGQTLMQQKIGRLNLDAQTDPMTGLYNRRNLQQTLEKWSKALHTFSVITLDIDHFKRINDQFGHNAGDMVIKTMAQCIRDISRESDMLYRTGGEEFLLLLAETPLESAGDVAERLRSYVEHKQIDGIGQVTVSLGVTNWPACADESTEVLILADKALYEAKRTGRNKVVIAEIKQE